MAQTPVQLTTRAALPCTLPPAMATTRLVSPGEVGEGLGEYSPPRGTGEQHTEGGGLLELRKAGPSHASGLWNWHCKAKVGLTWRKNEIDPKVGPDLPDMQATFTQC